MSYSLIQSTPDGLQHVARFDTYGEARAASQVGHDYTAAEIVSSSYVEIEDAHGQTLYLITWSRDEEAAE